MFLHGAATKSYTIKKSATAIIAALVIFSLLPYSLAFSQANAQNSSDEISLSIKPQDVSLYAAPNQKIATSFEVVNRSESDLQFNVESALLKNPVETSLLEETFAKIETTSINVLAGTNKSVDLQIEIPRNTESGSYTQLIYLVPQNSTSGDSQVGIDQGIGYQLAITVSNGIEDIDRQFAEQTRPIITIEKQAIPFIRPAVVKVTYSNQSNFHFIATGELRTINTESEELIDSQRFNANEELILAKSELSESFEIELYSGITSLFQDKKMVLRVTNDLTPGYIEDIIVIDGLPIWALLLPISIILIIAIAGGKFIQLKRSKKK